MWGAPSPSVRNRRPSNRRKKGPLGGQGLETGLELASYSFERSSRKSWGYGPWLDVLSLFTTTLDQPESQAGWPALPPDWPQPCVPSLASKSVARVCLEASCVNTWKPCSEAHHSYSHLGVTCTCTSCAVGRHFLMPFEYTECFSCCFSDEANFYCLM